MKSTQGVFLPQQNEVKWKEVWERKTLDVLSEAYLLLFDVHLSLKMY